MGITVTEDRERRTEDCATRALCHHHWVIGNADGRVSRGVCRVCGARKEFKNYLVDCVQATEEEYEAWLAKQRDGAKVRKSEDSILAGV